MNEGTETFDHEQLHIYTSKERVLRQSHSKHSHPRPFMTILFAENMEPSHHHRKRSMASRRPFQASRAPLDKNARELSEHYSQAAKEERQAQLNARTRLHKAVRQADMALLREVLQESVDLNARNHKGRTALHTAARFGRKEQLDLLLDQREVDVNACDNQKATPLHLATMYNQRDCVERLLKGGANTEVADERGHLARYYASTEEIMHLFDNPPKVTARKKGKIPDDAPQSRLYVGETLMMPPATPKGIQLQLAGFFKASFWSPEIDVKWSSPSIRELIYGDVDTAACMRRLTAGKKWIHLSAVSETWARNLVRSICAANAISADRYREMTGFVSRVMKEVDVEGPERSTHFFVRVLIVIGLACLLTCTSARIHPKGL